MGEERLMTVAEVARFLSVSTRTVLRLIASDQLPAYKVGGEYRISQSDLQEFLDQRRTSGEE